MQERETMYLTREDLREVRYLKKLADIAKERELPKKKAPIVVLNKTINEN